MIEGKRAADLTKLPAEHRADEADAYWRPSWRRDETVWFSTTAAPIKAEARKAAKSRSAWPHAPVVSHFISYDSRE
jgi:hypothetical protein